MMSAINHFTAVALNVGALAALGQVCAESPPAPAAMGSPSGCDLCFYSLLPGALGPHPATRYTIESDLPERLLSTGVLYASVPVLPADSSGNPVLSMRTQIVSGGFTAIDDDFDVFLWHTSSPGDGSQPRRIVIYVRNDGTGTVQVVPQQVMITDGSINTMGATLATRVLQEIWDTPVTTRTLSPGQGDVIAYGKRFAASGNGSDTSANVNCFGRVRADVANSDPLTHPTSLTVYVVAIGSANVSQNKNLAEALLNTGAASGDPFDLNTPPSGCANRRATGVYETFTWRNDPTTLDAAALPEEGVRFRMALGEINTQTCPAGRQTADLVLRPGYVRPDTVGNYMADYRVALRLINTDPDAGRALDLRFGRTGNPIGLAWQIDSGPDAPADAEVDARPVRTGWAGSNEPVLDRSFLESDGGPVVLSPCEERVVTIHFLILGNSSLPFEISAAPSYLSETIVDNRDPECSIVGAWPTSANSGFWGTDSQYHAGDGGASRVTWRPELPTSGRYAVFAWWVVSGNRATAAPYTLHHQSGSMTVTVNQTDLATASRWNSLGTFDFDSGTAGSVVLAADVPTNQLVSADAVRFALISVSPTVGDLDGDGDADLEDYVVLAGCLSGPGNATSPAGCVPSNFAAADLDEDGDVDLTDYAVLAEAVATP